MTWTVQYAAGFTGLTGITATAFDEAAGDVTGVSIAAMTEDSNRAGNYQKSGVTGLTVGALTLFVIAGDLVDVAWAIIPASGTVRLYSSQADAKLYGTTSLARALGVIAGKTADAGALAEIQATPAGATYDNTTDSLEAQKDGMLATILRTQLTEAYAADGAAPTAEQVLFLVMQSLHEFSISGATRTVKKLDGSTTAAVFTLNDANSPTATTRSA